MSKSSPRHSLVLVPRNSAVERFCTKTSFDGTKLPMVYDPLNTTTYCIVPAFRPDLSVRLLTLLEADRLDIVTIRPQHERAVIRRTILTGRGEEHRAKLLKDREQKTVRGILRLIPGQGVTPCAHRAGDCVFYFLRFQSSATRDYRSLLTCDYHDIPVGVAEPHLPMPSVRVDMRLFDYLGTQRTSSPDSGIEVVHLEPQQDSMPPWRRVRAAFRPDTGRTAWGAWQMSPSPWGPNRWGA